MLNLEKINELVKSASTGLKGIRRDPDIILWRDWYKGYVESFHHFYTYNSIKKVWKDKLSMQGARLVSKEWATLIVNEKVKIGLENDEQSEQLNDLLDKLKFRTRLSTAVEQGFALSNAAIAIDLEKISTNDEENEENEYTVDGCKLCLTTFNAWATVPIEIEDGEYKQVAFVKDNGRSKRYILHLINDKGLYDICIVDEKNSDRERKVSYIELNSPYKLFSIVHPNEVNNMHIDGTGYISIYANGIDELKALDNAYNSLDNEVVLGKKRIFIRSELTVKNKETGTLEPLFDPNDTVYNVLPAEKTAPGAPSEKSIQDTTTPLRVDQLTMAIGFHLNMLGKNVGLGSKYFKVDNTGMVTATQVISENSDTYNNLKKHEIVIRDNIVDICKALMFAFNATKSEEYDFDLDQNVIVQFDDSIIQDKDSEKASDTADVNNGVMSKVEYRMKWYNESEETANKKVKMFFGDDSLSNRINRFSNAYALGLMTPEDFVDNVYIDKSPKEKTKILEYLKSNKTASDISDISSMGTNNGADSSIFDNDDDDMDD